MKIRRSVAEIEELLDDEEAVLPSPKRAAATIIDQRTTIEMLRFFLKVSLSINTALLGAVVVKLLLI